LALQRRGRGVHYAQLWEGHGVEASCRTATVHMHAARCCERKGGADAYAAGFAVGGMLGFSVGGMGVLICVLCFLLWVEALLLLLKALVKVDCRDSPWHCWHC